MLRIEGLNVRYGPVAAVNGLDLEVADGEAVTLVGPNGAGKTTTLATVMGLVRPASGEITFQGESIVGLDPDRIVRRGLALVPEGRQIFGTLTVHENLLLGATVRRGDEINDDIEAALARFPVLGRYLHTHAGSLSGGEQQQLAIARALLARPRLLLLDEPSLGLAPQMVDLVFEALAELRERGVSLLLVEQNARRAIEFADRGYVMESAEIRLSGRREELLAGTDLESAYFGDENREGAAWSR